MTEQSTKVVEGSVDVSVVVPCFRCIQTIDRAIESVVAQTVQPKELILVDDDSRDGTLACLESWRDRFPGWIKVVPLMLNAGAGMARNAGWERATGRYVAFLDSDDSWHPQKLAVQYAFMEAHPDVLLCGHDHTIGRCLADDAPFNWNGQALGRWRMLVKNPFVTPSVMLRTNVTQRFAPRRRYMEDHLLWLCIALTGGKVYRLDAPLAVLHKAVVGVSGLSNHTRAMSKADFGNYLLLYRKGYLSWVELSLSWAWVGVKFFRRAVMLGLPRVWKRWRHVGDQR